MRTAAESPVKVRVMDETGSKVVAASNTAFSRAENDYTCVVEVDGLSPETGYVYEVEIANDPIEIEPRPAFRTFPLKGKSSTFKIGFGGGAGYTPWYEHMWLTILKHSPRAFLLLGDNVYIDTPTVPETPDLITEEIGEPEPTEPEQDTILEPVPTEPEPAEPVLEVLIHRNNFDPETITINKGDTVTWINMDDRYHLINSRSGDDFRSDRLGEGETFSFTFEKSGTVEYIDGVFGLKGTIIVK